MQYFHAWDFLSYPQRDFLSYPLNVLEPKCFVSTQIIHTHFIKKKKKDMQGLQKDKNTIESRPAPLTTLKKTTF